MFNQQPRWRGNYLEAGVGMLEVDLINLGNTPLTLRVHLEGPGGSVFSEGFVIPLGVAWQHISFSLQIPDLISAGDVASTLADVAQLWLIHNPEASDRSGIPPIDALLGFDNIQATRYPMVDEPLGDFNQDGTVDVADLARWEDEFGTVRSGDDFLQWQRNFGSMTSNSPSQIVAPEPSSFAMALFLLVIGLWSSNRMWVNSPNV